MSFLMESVDQVRDRVRKGFPSGVDELSATELPMLLNRIMELEYALVPFARAAGQVDENLPLVNVYVKDCQAASAALTPERRTHVSTVDDLTVF